MAGQRWQIGGGRGARRGGEENGDGCGEDWARASAFYRGRREAEVPRRLQWPAMKASVTRIEERGIYDRVKAHVRVKEGGVRWGRSMARERGSVAPLARRRERRRRSRQLGEGGRKRKGAAW
jgi:hypothetical protein